MKVLFSEPAASELEAIADWIAKDDPARAVSFVSDLRTACLDIGSRPIAYPFIEHRRNDGIRRKVQGNYLIFYRVRRNAVEILHVLHGARNYEGILFADEPE